MNDEHNEPEIPELKSLAQNGPAAPVLEDRVVATLRKEGLLHAAQGARRLVLRWAGAIAAVLVFLAGWFMGGRETHRHATTGQQEFLLLLRTGTMVEPSASVERERVREYGAWGRDLHQRGLLVSAAKLDDEARLLGAPSTDAVSQATDPGAVRGFFLIRAASLEEALRVARECPHLRHGGSVEFRAISH